jgi:hypothetical protein
MSRQQNFASLKHTTSKRIAAHLMKPYLIFLISIFDKYLPADEFVL